MFFSKKKIFSAAIILTLSTVMFTGCGEEQKTQQAQAPRQQVKVMKVIQRDTPISTEYAGHLVGTDEVKVQTKVSGNVVEKYVVGGQFVEAGQLLFNGAGIFGTS